jgi:hypothetical protein
MNDLQFEAGTVSLNTLSEIEKFTRMMRVDKPNFSVDTAYEAFVVAYGGGRCARKFFTTVNGDKYSLDRFLNFADPNVAQFPERQLNVHQVWNLIEDRLLPGMYPIAALPGGDFLILSYTDSGDSSVWLWFHERSLEGAPALERVAENFSAFLEKLTGP